MSRMTYVCALAAALSTHHGGLTGHARAQPPEQSQADTRYDAATGRDLTNWPRDRHVDHGHMLLEIDIPDMEVPRLSARCVWTVSAISRPQSTIWFDARQTMKFSSVRIDGAECVFTHEGDVLNITLPSPLAPGRPAAVELRYEAERPHGRGGFMGPTGLTWLRTPSRGRDASRGAQIYSQGQAQWNSYWFPCRDFPDERITSELIVTAPEPYQVVSNGRLQSLSRAAGRARYHWVQDKEHAAYLVSMVVGKFDVVSVGGPSTARPGLDMPVYAPLGAGASAKRAFAATPEMVAYFERLLDEPYPWDKYAQVLVRGFPGGMENTSATTLGEFSGTGGPDAHEDLLVHELAHQWFGDLMTCRTWAHLWLNEGWATFSEYLWMEHKGGRAVYFNKVRSEMRNFASGNRATLPQTAPMVSPRYRSPDDAFDRVDNVYAKGGLFLHTLRMRLGDETFWKAVRLYVDRFKGKAVETEDFRRVLEEVSGLNLERVFHQACYRSGVPHLNVTARWTDGTRPHMAGGELKFTVEQTQTINADNPAYALSVPVFIQTGDAADAGRWHYVDVDERREELSVYLIERPRAVRIDPEAAVLGMVTADTRLTAPATVPASPEPSKPVEPGDDNK